MSKARTRYPFLEWPEVLVLDLLGLGSSSQERLLERTYGKELFATQPYTSLAYGPFKTEEQLANFVVWYKENRGLDKSTKV